MDFMRTLPAPTLFQFSMETQEKNNWKLKENSAYYERFWIFHQEFDQFLCLSNFLFLNVSNEK